MQSISTIQILKVPTAGAGFFGSNELYHFFKKDVEVAFESKNNCQLVLDFSNVIYWDISALLWIVVALDHFQKRNESESKNISFKLRLPQPIHDNPDISRMSKQDKEYLKSADYLRRWRFIDALKNLVDDPNDLLVDSQKGYIDSEPRYYYPKMVAGPSGLIEQLISVRLAEIRNLVDFSSPQHTRQIRRERIETCLQEFIEHAVAPILSNQCGIDMDIANMFITHLLLEGLSNVLQHPNATIGMFSVSRIGPDKLVLAIADNGDSICKTIYKYYRHVRGNRLNQLQTVYSRQQLQAEIRQDLIVFATKEGASRKWLDMGPDWEELSLEQKRGSEIGLGLTHIRDATIGDFKGNIVIAAGGVSVRFTTTSRNTKKEPEFENYDFPWPGNLLRIQIPAKEKPLSIASINN